MNVGATCPACDGGALPCKGGDNARCLKRDPRPACVALILDRYGGARTVVTQMDALIHHARSDEICHVVPHCVVHEPIAWDDIPSIIRRARSAFERWLERRPNLGEAQHHAVMLYRLRQQRHSGSRGSLDVSAIVET